MTVSDSESEPLVLSNLEDGVFRITLNRPARANTVTPELYDSLRPLIERAEIDRDIRCVVLTGSGKAFCAGRDLKAGATVPKADSAGEWMDSRIDYLRRSADIARLLHLLPKATIAMINGACAGAGLSLAGACDIRIAARSAVLTSAFVRVGLSGDMGGIWFWSKILGAGKARRLYLMSERFEGAAAEAFGLVDRVCDDGELLATTTTLARELAAGSSRAFRYCKEALSLAEHSSFAAVLDLEATNMAISGIDAAFASGEFVNLL